MNHEKCKDPVDLSVKNRRKGSKLKRALCAVAVAASAMSVMALPCHAMDLGMTFTADQATKEIADGVSPFTEPSVIILCAVSGLKLGFKLIKSASH